MINGYTTLTDWHNFISFDITIYNCKNMPHLQIRAYTQSEDTSCVQAFYTQDLTITSWCIQNMNINVINTSREDFLHHWHYKAPIHRAVQFGLRSLWNAQIIDCPDFTDMDCPNSMCRPCSIVLDLWILYSTTITE